MILGRQGAGKGTQSARLADRLDVDHISTGDLFRAAVASGSALGRRVQAILDAGDLVPDQVVLEVVAQRLHRARAEGRGYLLDGFPRTVAQAEALAEISAPRGIDLTIDLEVPRDVVLARLASRRVCVDCGTNYSVDMPPKYDMVCDVCGGDVVQRDDDTEKAISQRLALYERETAPLIEWFQGRGLLEVVDGTGHPDDVTDRLVRTIDRRREPR